MCVFVVYGNGESGWCIVTRTSKKAMEESDTIEEKPTAGWKDQTKERKRCNCSRRSEVAPNQSSM